MTDSPIARFDSFGDAVIEAEKHGVGSLTGRVAVQFLLGRGAGGRIYWTVVVASNVLGLWGTTYLREDGSFQ